MSEVNEPVGGERAVGGERGVTGERAVRDRGTGEVGRSAVESEELQRDARAPEEVGPPQGVLLGAGGDPLMIGLPIFLVGSLALGFELINVAGPTAMTLAGIIPLILVATAFFQMISAIWAIFLGQSIVATIFGTFSGFWAGLAILLLGLLHNWFLIPKAEIPQVQKIFFLSWAILFFFLTINTLRLPVIYPMIIALVVAALVLVILGLYYVSSLTTLWNIAGICVFAFCALGFIAWHNVNSIAMGGRDFPKLGPALIK